MVIKKIVHVIGRGYGLCTTLPKGQTIRENDKVSINGKTYNVNRVEGNVNLLGDKGIVNRYVTIFVAVDEMTAKTFKLNDKIIIVG